MMMYRHALSSALVLLALFFMVGCAATPAPSPVPSAAGHTRMVEQDPKLRITSAEVMELFSQVYGDQVLVKANLDRNERFLLVDTRPLGRYQEGHVPGAIHMTPGEVAAQIDQLPRDRMVIFYCGGLACPLSTQAAKAALEKGLTNVRVWYEGDPGWHQAGGYMISETGYVYHMMTQSDEQNFLLIDSRPSAVHRKAFIPGSASIPIQNWDLKKSLLPNDLNTKLIFYCGGHACPHSHNSAKKAKEMGYKWVSVYSAGEPEWKRDGLPLWGNEPSGVVDVAIELPTAPGGLPRTISGADFTKLMKESPNEVAILDVRSAGEFAAGHLPGAVNIPDDQFHANYEQLVKKVPTGKRVIIHCVTGIRAGGVYHAIATRGGYDNPKGIQYLDASMFVNSDGTFEIN
ncbi:MAG TPA: sulfurtransferase [Desulfurivibrio alkaliphilus]|uniref:Sulfurtransferase n=1 Tax=Desulfurivibrio alkaliphilus TaxID=427923 RepID=A0A7C2TIV2_9BACT|nr:sulfurtransferase [Desulfurivibrio alkaliphilus]